MLSVNSSRCCCKRYPGLVSMALWWRSGWSLEIQTSAFKRWAAGEEEEERTRYLLARLEGLSVGKVKTQTVKIFGKGYRRTRPLQDLRRSPLPVPPDRSLFTVNTKKWSEPGSGPGRSRLRWRTCDGAERTQPTDNSFNWSESVYVHETNDWKPWVTRGADGLQPPECDVTVIQYNNQGL